jgi:hypothetical protein
MAFSWLVLMPCAARVVAQPPPPPEAKVIRERVDAQNWRLENIRNVDEAAKRATDRGVSVPIEPDGRFYNRKLTDQQKKLLAPAAEVEAAHRDFLRQDHTGLIRLLPRGKYEFNVTVSADNPELILPIRGGGAFYSFVEKKHPFGPWSEISLQEGRLVVGFQPQSLALLTRLGDVPLESLTATTPAIAYLAQLAPPTERIAARDQSVRNFQGFVVADRFYNSTLPAMVNQTYVLRSTIYKKEGHMRVVYGGGSVYVPHPYEYSGADELIVFRILSAGDDGSLTLLWKRLQKFSPPKLEERRSEVAKERRGK